VLAGPSYKTESISFPVHESLPPVPVPSSLKVSESSVAELRTRVGVGEGDALTEGVGEGDALTEGVGETFVAQYGSMVARMAARTEEFVPQYVTLVSGLPWNAVELKEVKSVGIVTVLNEPYLKA
jgi:hypothetical protein